MIQTEVTVQAPFLSRDSSVISPDIVAVYHQDCALIEVNKSVHGHLQILAEAILSMIADIQVFGPAFTAFSYKS